ncbi:predicted protein [Thalassiosira pseudonana CCMP1335]|uniref:Uncharacterized protein n=1 Tax=Thalassiosira pseudonana TaxID=35128 RepID=B8BY65_THAPS|nr:predicted protein [Thalassiosira pseudonana CCMP1335]EED94323.1 predicted protein [Thalassiosira pseudonana CCMP1335]|eukprot:scaffold228_cov173-Alexandrium_tamarense.AAC.6
MTAAELKAAPAFVAFATPRSRARSQSLLQNKSLIQRQHPTHHVTNLMMVEAPATLVGSPVGITLIQEFDPIVNVPALSSFVIIAVVFTLLQIRINAVSGAAKRRSEALNALRKAESLQLSASDVGIDASDRPTQNQVGIARDEYEKALRDELSLRTIIPGVRIVAPNDPKRDEEERAAAKRFLGWDSDEFGDNEEDRNEIAAKLSETNDNDQINGLSIGSTFLLAGVATMLLALLWTLSFDPMTADGLFTTLGGSPPSELPLSSW